jgi:hypothetical protein
MTTAVWLSVTFLTKPEPKNILLAFYRRVRPSAYLWGPIAKEATEVKGQSDGLFDLIDWLSGVAMIYGILFGTGKILLGEPIVGIIYLLAGVVFGAIIFLDLNKRGWETIGK